MDRVLTSKLTYDDYAAAPADGMTYQVVDGELIVTPAPSPFHQRASKRLQRQLESYFEAGGRAEVFNAPIDLILSPHDIVQPDLVVVADATAVTARGIEGIPLLIVEVLSPTSVKHDRQLKARRYAELGVPHYWIVDQADRRIECYARRESAYALVVSAQAPDTLELREWPGLSIDLGAIWPTDRG